MARSLTLEAGLEADMKTYSQEIRKAEAMLERAELALTQAELAFKNASDFHNLASSNVRKWKRLAAKAASEVVGSN